MQTTRIHSTGTLRDGIRDHNIGPSNQRAQQQAGEDAAQGRSLGYLAVLPPHQCNVPGHGCLTLFLRGKVRNDFWDGF